MKIDIQELCDALGVEYDPAKSGAFYLMLVKQYRLHYNAAQSCTHQYGKFVCSECGETIPPPRETT